MSKVSRREFLQSTFMKALGASLIAPLVLKSVKERKPNGVLAWHLDGVSPLRKGFKVEPTGPWLLGRGEHATEVRVFRTSEEMKKWNGSGKVDEKTQNHILAYGLEGGVWHDGSIINIEEVKRRCFKIIRRMNHA